MCVSKCVARQLSDSMVCKLCNEIWDMNDPEPPRCAYEDDENFVEADIMHVEDTDLEDTLIESYEEYDAGA